MKLGGERGGGRRRRCCSAMVCRQVNSKSSGPFLLRLFFNVYQSFQSKLSRSTFYRANNIFLAALLRGGSSCCHCKAASRQSQSNSNQKHHFTSSFTTDSSTESQSPRSSWQTSCLLCLFLMATSERRPKYMDGVPFREQEDTVLPPNNHHVWRLLQIQHEYYVVLHHVSLTSIPSLSLLLYAYSLDPTPAPPDEEKTILRAGARIVGFLKWKHLIVGLFPLFVLLLFGEGGILGPD